ncbi:MAG: hypothetical protein LH473_07970 [Chitinophagales bacterium]|nr:hypothetical protein [Chitinophagales bacterium]
MDFTILIPILITLGAFAMVFGLRYLSNKERMAMIERGIAPVEPDKRSRPLITLKFGLILLGVGVGLFFAFFLTTYVLHTSEEQSPAIYFGMIGICGGLGLVISYLFEKSHEEKQNNRLPK